MYLDFVSRLAVKDLYFYANAVKKMNITTEVVYNQTVIALEVLRTEQKEVTKLLVNDFNFIDSKMINVQETPIWNAFLLERFGTDYAEVLKEESPALFEKAKGLIPFVKSSLKTYDEKLKPLERNLCHTMGEEQAEQYLNNSVEAMVSTTPNYIHSIN